MQGIQTAITSRRDQYLLRQNGDIVGFSLKCASTLIRQLARPINIVSAERALTAKAQGYNVILVVRHPLDRLVSNYCFWRKSNPEGVKHMFPNLAGIGTLDLQNMTIEEWYEFTQANPDLHWADQAWYHTYNGKLIPNRLYPIEALLTLNNPKINASKRIDWESYFTDSFREEMEARYKDDLALYNRAVKEWDGQKPILLYRR